MNAVKPRSVLVHGRAVNCVEAGSGPVLLLIHGMAGNIGNWQEVIGPLARHPPSSCLIFRVTAPRRPVVAITRSGRSLLACATCSSCSATTARRSW